MEPTFAGIDCLQLLVAWHGPGTLEKDLMAAL